MRNVLLVLLAASVLQWIFLISVMFRVNADHHEMIEKDTQLSLRIDDLWEKVVPR